VQLIHQHANGRVLTLPFLEAVVLEASVVIISGTPSHTVMPTDIIFLHAHAGNSGVKRLINSMTHNLWNGFVARHCSYASAERWLSSKDVSVSVAEHPAGGFDQFLSMHSG
jgi:hypothetical protein